MPHRGTRDSPIAWQEQQGGEPRAQLVLRSGISASTRFETIQAKSVFTSNKSSLFANPSKNGNRMPIHGGDAGKPNLVTGARDSESNYVWTANIRTHQQTLW